IHWMLPLDLEKQLNSVVLACGALNVVLAVVIAPRFGAVGMAWVVVATQAAVALGAWLVLRWMKLDPFSNGAANGAEGLDCRVQYTAEPVAK
ncbi:MAG TPA: hypothetical protein VFT60_00835, partial [Bryobacteraceae bacterium]|nr:hypothetical protein [Bryobacteraceae bacterium]